MPLQLIGPSPAAANAAEKCDENFAALEHVGIYGRNPNTSTGLTWGYYGGRWSGVSVANGTLTLTNAATNYVVVKRDDGVISTSTSATNWDNVSLYARVYQLTTAGSVVTATQDHRAGPFGVHGGFPSVRTIASVSAAYTFVGLDATTQVLHPSADTTARTWTIPANSALPYRVGTVLEVVNQNAAGVLTIAITTDTMRLAGAGTTGSRTLAANGIGFFRKVTATEWLASGTGLT